MTEQQEKLLVCYAGLREADQERSSEDRRKAGHLWPSSTNEGLLGLWILFLSYLRSLSDLIRYDTLKVPSGFCIENKL